MGRSPCCEKTHTSKGAWTRQEDCTLIAYIQTHGEGSWRSLPKAAGLSRCGKSCRLRWVNYLRPDLKRGNFCEEENELIIKLHALLGNKWSMIAGRLPGRTDNEIKNHWNSHIKKKLRDKGIDPKTHGPIASYDRLRSPNKRNQAETTPFLQNWAQKVASEERPDVNLELSISLPSAVCSESPAKGDFGNDVKETSGGTSSLTSDAGNDLREYKSVCCHIGLQIGGGRCYWC